MYFLCLIEAFSICNPNPLASCDQHMQNAFGTNSISNTIFLLPSFFFLYISKTVGDKIMNKMWV